MKMKDAVGALAQFNLVPIAFILFISAGLARPPPQFAPPSHCAAPATHYHAAEQLRFVAVLAAMGAVSATSSLKILLAGDGSLQKVGARRLRLLFLLALAFSAAGLGFAQAAHFYLFQAKFGVPACMSGAGRATVYGFNFLLGSVVAFIYGNLAVDVLGSG